MLRRTLLSVPVSGPSARLFTPSAMSFRAMSTVPPPSNFGPVSGDVEPRFLEMVKLNFDKCRAVAKVDKDMFEMIKSCNSMLRVNFPLRRDDGSIEVRQVPGSAKFANPHSVALPVAVLFLGLSDHLRLPRAAQAPPFACEGRYSVRR
jgi:hypothetical protein